MQTWKCKGMGGLITPRTTSWPTTHWNMEGFRWVKPVMYIHFNSIQCVQILLLRYKFQRSTTKGAVYEAVQTHVGVNIEKFKKLKFWFTHRVYGEKKTFTVFFFPQNNNCRNKRHQNLTWLQNFQRSDKFYKTNPQISACNVTHCFMSNVRLSTWYSSTAN